MNMRNAEGYFDPTASIALHNVDREARARAYRPLICIASPYAGDVERNTAGRGRTAGSRGGQGVRPLAPHLIFPQFLNDGDEAERALGLWFARILLTKCDELWVFGETISPGMAAEIAKADRRGIPTRFFTEDCEEVRR
jgi:hypothetical protein